MPRPSPLLLSLVSCAVIAAQATVFAGDYPVIETRQAACFDNQFEIEPPSPGAAFYGQDAQYEGRLPQYLDNGDGTVSDLVTGLMWQQNPGEKMGRSEAEALVGQFDLAGYHDWRLPTIKELYSLIRFDGTDPSGMTGNDTSGLVPFIDPVFAFAYGDPAVGDRIIDSQYLSSTLYVGTTMQGEPSVFGVNFADGRIKGYTIVNPPYGLEKPFFVQFVRGGTEYGVNDFVDNGDGTVTDRSTGLMWLQADSGSFDAGPAGDGALNWQQALAWAEAREDAGYDDWRLPDAKELQSIVDYTRAPLVTGTAACAPVFHCSAIVDEGGGNDFPFYWTSTSHRNWMDQARGAVYVAFGTGYGFMETPPGSGNYVLLDVHGAGCQRSDPKAGDPASYPHGLGPQGDVIRILNHVRPVRLASATSGVEDDRHSADDVPEAAPVLVSAAPNPFNPGTTVRFSLPEAGLVRVTVHDLRGRHVATLESGSRAAGTHEATWNGLGRQGSAMPSGVYCVAVQTGDQQAVTRVTLVR